MAGTWYMERDDSMRLEGDEARLWRGFGFRSSSGSHFLFAFWKSDFGEGV